MANRADTFNRTDESPLATPSDAGSDWVSINGTIAVVTNEARGTSVEARSYLECGTADGDVVATIGTVNLGSGHVLGRVTDANNSLFLLLSSTSFTLWKQVAGSYSNLYSVGSLTVVIGDTFGLRMAGDQVSILHNGSVVGVAQTVSDFTAVTKHGIRFDNPATLDAFTFTEAAPAAPTLDSATVLTEGNSLSLVFSESVTIGAGGNGGVTVTPSGGAATATYASGSGSDTLVYTLNRTLATSETITTSYTQPGNGIEATSGGTDVATFTDEATTNNTINAPTIGTATAAGTDAIDLTWEDNATNETQFEYQRALASDFVGATTVVVDTEDAESTQSASLDDDTEYFYRVRAKNGNGVSLWSGTVSATTDDDVIIPGEIVFFAKDDESISLTGTDATGGTGLYVYDWYRSLAPFAEGGGTLVDAAGTLSHTSNSLASDTRYYFMLKYTDENDDVAYSPLASFETDPTEGSAEAATRLRGRLLPDGLRYRGLGRF
jgi:hypothetical protein